MSMQIAMDELIRAGLCDRSVEPHLTDKGRYWLRALGEIETFEVADVAEQDADFILSTSGLSR